MNMSKAAAVAMGMLLLTGCMGARIQYDFDVRATFTAYHSFDWASSPSRTKGKLRSVGNAIMERRVKGAIERELVAKGFRLEATGNPDFLVAYYPVFRERSYRTAHHFAMGWGHRPFGFYGGPVITREHRYTEGTIVVEILDFKTRNVVWHGAAVGALTGLDTPEAAEAAVATEVPRLLTGFPPQR